MKKTKSIYTVDVILVMAASFLFMFSVMFVTPLINGYALSLGADSILAGIITGSMSIVSIFLRPIAGNLVDLYSKYCLSLIGGILILIGVSGYWLVNTSGLLILFNKWYRICLSNDMYDNVASIFSTTKVCRGSNGFLWINECLSYGCCTTDCH